MTTINSSIPIKEMFVSIQGEGPNAGKPSLFIRVMGCNLKCKFCDTKSSRTMPLNSSKYDKLPAVRKRILETLKEHKHITHLVFTGGEPSIYKDAIKKLFLDRDFWQEVAMRIESVDIETNGFKGIDWEFLVAFGFDTTICWSPKFQYEYSRTLTKSTRANVIVKLPVHSSADALGQLAWLVEKSDITDKDRIYLQPIDASKEIARELIQKDCYGCKLSMQLHKMIGVK